MISRLCMASLLIAAIGPAGHIYAQMDVPIATTATITSSKTVAGRNPIRLTDTPDPGVVRANGKWYVYHTSGWNTDARYPILVSDDLTSWTQVGNIFEEGHTPPWASKARNWWAPEVHKINDKYVAYFTTREDSTDRFVIGAAIADRPEGPFVDVGEPIRRTDGVGLIDVNYFKDPKSGRQYIIWKEDRNDFNPQEPTPLIMQEVTTDGLKMLGKPRELLRNDQPWEGVLVEAPTLIHHNGWYYLFYSANIFTDDAYSVGVARSRDVWGPYVKYPKPILSHDVYFSGPAHQFVIQDENGVWNMFYHARVKSMQQRRYLMHDVIKFNSDGWPVINDGHPGPPIKNLIQ